MGTRGCIAVVTNPYAGHDAPIEFEGRYHHWDSYPTALGKTLWNAYHGHFQRDLSAMLTYLIEKHTGWSTINGADFSRKAGYRESGERCAVCGKEQRDFSYHEQADHKFRHLLEGPKCYCHGSRHEPGFVLTEGDAQESGCEWVYAFNLDTDTMYVLSSQNEDGSKMRGAFGFGNPDAYWVPVAAVSLDGPEPEWESVACGSDWERCTHYGWAHFPELEDDPRYAYISTAQYLGRKPLDMNAAYGVRIGLDEYTIHGGTSEGWLRSDTRASREDPTLRELLRSLPEAKRWWGTLRGANGKTVHRPIATIAGDEYIAMPGVEWLFPPLKPQTN